MVLDHQLNLARWIYFKEIKDTSVYDKALVIIGNIHLKMIFQLKV
jgi:hypothetical protein